MCVCVCLFIFWGCWSDAAECFCLGMCCDYFTDLFGVVFLCNCLFFNDCGMGFCCCLVFMALCARMGCVFCIFSGDWSDATE